MSTALDMEFVRAQFPAFAEPSLKGQAFFENAGGSYACQQVIDHLSTYYSQTKVQPYYPYAASEIAGAAMDRSYERFAAYLNVAPHEVHFGPSTTQNTYVLAQAMQNFLRAGDEIIITNQDHEANIGAWRRLADRGVVVREWQVNTDTAQLEKRDLIDLLSDRTRLLAMTHCSNLVGQINQVRKFANLAHAAGALVVIDGVSYAPHGLPDVDALHCDAYLFSLYKTYGPHQGAMVVREDAMRRLTNQSHYFNEAEDRKRLIPAGPDHAQVAAAQGVIDYFDALHDHHFGDGWVSELKRAERVRELLRSAEQARLKPLLTFLKRHPKARVIGTTRLEHRAPTVSIVPRGQTPQALVEKLTEHGIMSGYGDFYAARLVDALNIDADTGVARFSLVHYTSDHDINKLLVALDRCL